MKLMDYLDSQYGRQSQLARSIGVTPVELHDWKKGNAPVPVKACVAIEQQTNGAVSRKDLRPDDWMQIWPELEG